MTAEETLQWKMQYVVMAFGASLYDIKIQLFTLHMYCTALLRRDFTKGQYQQLEVTSMLG